RSGFAMSLAPGVAIPAPATTAAAATLLRALLAFGCVAGRELGAFAVFILRQVVFAAFTSSPFLGALVLELLVAIFTLVLAIAATATAPAAPLALPLFLGARLTFA